MKDKLNFDNLKESDKKQVKSLLLVICLVGVVLVGTSYAWLTITKAGEKSVGLTAGTLNLTYDDTGSEVITLTDVLPVSDSEGLVSTAYTFKVTNTGNINATYTIYLDDEALTEGDARLADKYVKYAITKNSSEPIKALVSSLTASTDSNKPGRALITSTLAPNGVDTYQLRVWLDEDAFDSEATEKTFKKVLRIEASQ